MSEDWKLLTTTTDPMRAQIIVAMLESHGVKVIDLDQQDSSYNSFGTIKIHVNSADFDKAQSLLDNQADEGSTAKID